MIRILILCILSSTLLYGRTVYTIIACDTITPLRIATEYDLLHMQKMARTTAKLLKASLHLHKKIGKELSLQSIATCLKRVRKAKKHDILLFYYSGHGFQKNNKKSPWPHLFFPHKHEMIGMQAIVKKLTNTKAGLKIILFDCCNNQPQTLNSPLLHKTAPMNWTLQKASRSLFHQKGTIVAIGASPGQPALAMTNGSLFTNAFLFSLQTESHKDFVSWQSIFKKTKELCEQRNQTPFITIMLK